MEVAIGERQFKGCGDGRAMATYFWKKITVNIAGFRLLHAFDSLFDDYNVMHQVDR